MTNKEVLDLKPAPRLEQIGDKCGHPSRPKPRFGNSVAPGRDDSAAHRTCQSQSGKAELRHLDCRAAGAGGAQLKQFTKYERLRLRRRAPTGRGADQSDDFPRRDVISCLSKFL